MRRSRFLAWWIVYTLANAALVMVIVSFVWLCLVNVVNGTLFGGASNHTLGGVETHAFGFLAVSLALGALAGSTQARERAGTIKIVDGKAVHTGTE